MYKREYYKQIRGTVMGFPISPIVDYLYMEYFEHVALTIATNPPDIWYRYVDDTLPKQTRNVDNFTHHINNINPYIKFITEQKKDGKLPFLDTLVHVNKDGSTKTAVYRKTTHTNQYLNFNFNHHLEHKRLVVLLHRAEQLNTNQEDKDKEIQHVHNVPWPIDTRGGFLNFCLQATLQGTAQNQNPS